MGIHGITPAKGFDVHGHGDWPWALLERVERFGANCALFDWGMGLAAAVYRGWLPGSPRLSNPPGEAPAV